MVTVYVVLELLNNKTEVCLGYQGQNEYDYVNAEYIFE